MTRQKKVVISSLSRSEAEESFAAYAKAHAEANAIAAKMDVEMTKIREKYQEKLAKLTEIKDEHFAKLEFYATNNRDEFGKKKSIDFTHGILGFRTGTPKLKTRKGYTWASVTNLIKEFLPTYIRVSEEPAKDRLLADRDVPEVYELFPKIGILVDQDETFFVEPKKEELIEA